MGTKQETAWLSSVKGAIKRPTFDGKTVWSIYRRQMEAPAECNGWSKQDEMAALILPLKGKALNIPNDKQKIIIQHIWA